MKHKSITLVICLVLAGCVTAKVEQLRQTGHPVVVQAGESVVVLGRRHRADRESEVSFNSCISRALESRRLEVFPEQEFKDALFPWLEARTAPISSAALNRLLDEPLISSRVEQTGVRYMVWVDGQTDKTDSGGGMSCGLSPAGGGCFGFGWWEKESEYEVSIWDVRRRTSIGKVAVNASGTSYMPAVIIPIPLIARTEAAACDGIADQISELLTVGDARPRLVPSAHPRPGNPAAVGRPPTDRPVTESNER